MKRLFFALQFLLFLVFNFFLLLTLYQFTGTSTSQQLFGYKDPEYNHKEAFNPSLQRLNSVDKLVGYCDSLYSEASYSNPSIKFEKEYPEIISETVRNRFYHGYSLYWYNNNYVAMLMSRVTVRGLRAIVIPDDILKFSYAACSQQSIVFMEVLKQKGFVTRKVEFKGQRNGHFCFEVFYNGAWHFFDSDMEPDTSVLNAYNRPSVAFLTSHKDVLLKAYHDYPAEKISDIFLTYTYGRAGTFAAPKAILFQQVTKVFSYTMWLLSLVAFILVRRKYLRLRSQYVRNNRIHISPIQPGTTSVLYPNC